MLGNSHQNKGEQTSTSWLSHTCVLVKTKPKENQGKTKERKKKSLFTKPLSYCRECHRGIKKEFFKISLGSPFKF